MIAFWISAAVLSALAAALVAQRSAAAVAAGRAAEDPSLAVFRGQLAELDDLAERGLLPASERRSAKSEAARRLLSAADQTAPEAAPAKPRRQLVGAVAALIPLAALGLYWVVGSPGTPDQPFAARMAAWRAADPTTLSPPQMAALLSQAAREHPTDPMPLYYLARVQASLGEIAAAEHDLRRAIVLAPTRADLWSLLGAILTGEPGGDGSPEAAEAFRKAHALDPGDPNARYFLTRARIAAGDVDGGLAAWRALDGDLAAGDPRKAALEQEMVQVGRTRALPPPDAAPQDGAGAAAQQLAMIRAMVARLAARLQASPDDPAGWARLIHAYGVLSDGASQAAARSRALAQFKGDPATEIMIETAR